jgi:hypothetical protein
MLAGALHIWVVRFCMRHSSPPDVEVFENRTIFI